ncbi:MAG: lantibiotic dehydratase family protein [Bacteroidales bacterium]|jgi:hypothetical protein
MGKRIDYDSYDHFMLRAPLLPIVLLSEIPPSPDGLFLWLKALWKNDLIREGVLLGSCEFSRIIDQEFLVKDSSNADAGIMYSLLRYICRFSSRCTPFGTFAGFSTGEFGLETDISLSESRSHKLNARPDMEYLMGLAKLLMAEPALREGLQYSGNTTLYKVGSRWHYIEVVYPGGNAKKVYDIVMVDDMGAISGILEFCQGGKALEEIRVFLINGGWAKEDVLEFVQSLVESQILVGGLEPVICGPEYIDFLITRLRQASIEHEMLLYLIHLKGIFQCMSRPGSVIFNVPKLETALKGKPIIVNWNHLIQVDMKLASDSMILDVKITSRVLLGLRILKALSAAHPTDVLKEFREAFFKRYGESKVLMVKALDPETGIGLEGSGEGYWTDPVPWIDDLKWGPSFHSQLREAAPGNPWLTQKYHDTLRTGSQYIEVESSDLPTIDIHNGIWPYQMTAMIELYQTGSQDEEMVHVLMGSAGNPANLLGRFGFADPDSTQDWISELITDENAEYPDTLFAEVVHLPEDRTGNILQRPSFTDYEIPYLADSAKPIDRQIPVTDLLISLEDNRLVLQSATSGRKICPRMTNAYNHQLGSLAVYKFLHRLELQDNSQVYRPDWGSSHTDLFTPGIRFKNLILSAPIWTIKCADIAQWIHFEKNQVDLSELNTWRNERHMPEKMVWIAADQELYLNWTNPNLVMALWDTIRSYRLARFRPFYLSSGTPVRSQEGFHANQFVFCYRKT